MWIKTRDEHNTDAQLKSLKKSAADSAAKQLKLEAMIEEMQKKLEEKQKKLEETQKEYHETQTIHIDTILSKFIEFKDEVKQEVKQEVQEASTSVINASTSNINAAIQASASNANSVIATFKKIFVSYLPWSSNVAPKSMKIDHIA